jgi:hypothetical protein
VSLYLKKAINIHETPSIDSSFSGDEMQYKTQGINHLETSAKTLGISISPVDMCIDNLDLELHLEGD